MANDMRLRNLVSLVGLFALVASTSLVGCGIQQAEGVDPDFDNDWVDDFENDDDEDKAEEEEQGDLDLVDDLDDVEVLDGEKSGGEGEAGGSEGSGGPEEGTIGEGEGEGEIPGETLPSGSKRPPKRRPHGPISILQDDPHFSGRSYGPSGPFFDPAKANERVGQAKALGADVIRIMLWWSHVAPEPKSTTKPEGFVSSKPDGYDFRILDSQVEAARAHGLKVMITVTAGSMPFWASEDPSYCVDDAKKGAWSCAWKPNVKEYAKFVTAVGRHVKAKKYRIWAWTFVNEPNIGAFLKDASDKQLAYRYRRLWFAARKHLRKTAKVRARVFFGDMANNQHDFEPDAARWRLFNQSLCLDLERDPEVVSGFCPQKKRKVHATGVAFHPYAATPGKARDSVEFLQKLVDAAAAEGRIGKNRGLYMTESAFLTARAADSSKLGAALSVTAAQQAVYMNITDRLLSSNPRVKSLSQYELVDEGRGTWDSGLRYAFGQVVTTSGENVTGDFLEVKLESHVTVATPSGARKILWNEIATNSEGRKQFWAIDQGSPKPAYAAYRIAIDLVKDGSDVVVWGLARPDTGAGFTLEALTPSGWIEHSTVSTDRLGYGKKRIPIGTATAWRIRFGGELSREARL